MVGSFQGIIDVSFGDAVKNQFFQFNRIILFIRTGDRQVVCVGNVVISFFQRIKRLPLRSFHIIQRFDGADSDPENDIGTCFELADQIACLIDDVNAVIIG